MIHDGGEEVLQAFPEAKGQQGDLKETGRPQLSLGRFGDMPPPRAHSARIETETSAARFFYCAKASKSDRGVDNTHPTVKPTDLMRYLCRLVTPLGGVVLDPFMGSGSTGKAAILEGFRFVGCELQAEYIEIARARIQHAAAVEQHQYELEIA
ncbi:DNA methyltransferase [Achromobacter ruhlandii]|uniref:DNA methyltransferase n=1 Tax=Achromobacter ruhlandii TaxID=72557 RepID=UPI003557948E